nr:MAG TPA: hypothetical protein [Bacteriophage sp.]
MTCSIKKINAIYCKSTIIRIILTSNYIIILSS